MRILVVDDEEEARKATVQVLAPLEVPCVEARSGVEALNLLASGEEVGVLVVDLVMPGLHGLDVLLKAREHFPDLPVVMLASAKEQPLVARALKLGANDAARKPVQPEELLPMVRRALGQGLAVVERARKLRKLQVLGSSADTLAQISGEEIAPDKLFENPLLLQTTLELISGSLDAEKVSLILVHEKTQELRVVASTGFDPETVGKEVRKVGEGIAGWVAKHGEAVLVKDIAKDTRFSATPYGARYRTASFLCVPVKLRGRVIGVVTVNDKRGTAAFDEEDLAILSAFARQIYLTIENTLVHADLKRYADRVALLNEVNRVLSEEAVPAQVYRELVRIFHRVLDVEAASLHLMDERGEKLKLAAGRTLVGSVAEGPSVAPGAGITGWVAAHGEVALVEEASKDERVDPVLDAIGEVAPRSILAAPIRHRGQVLAVIKALNKREEGFGARDLDLLEAIGAVGAIAVKHGWLHHNLEQALDDMARLEMEIEALKKSLGPR